MKNIKSAFGSFNVYDVIKGFVVAVLAGIMPIVQSVISEGHFTFDWPLIGKVAASSAVGYLIKQFFTNSNGDLATTEKK